MRSQHDLPAPLGEWVGALVDLGYAEGLPRHPWPLAITDTGRLALQMLDDRLRQQEVTPEDTPKNSAIGADALVEIVGIVGDENAARILAIANQKDRPGEERYADILRLDRRFA